MTINIHEYFDVQAKRISKFKFQFIALYYKDEIVLNTWLQVVDLIELLQSYQKNQLVFGKEYSIDNCIDVELYKKDINVLLALSVHKKWVYLDKVSAAQMAHKLNRILYICDLFITQE